MASGTSRPATPGPAFFCRWRGASSVWEEKQATCRVYTEAGGPPKGARVSGKRRSRF